MRKLEVIVQTVLVLIVGPTECVMLCRLAAASGDTKWKVTFYASAVILCAVTAETAVTEYRALQAGSDPLNIPSEESAINDLLDLQGTSFIDLEGAICCAITAGAGQRALLAVLTIAQVAAFCDVAAKRLPDGRSFFSEELRALSGAVCMPLCACGRAIARAWRGFVRFAQGRLAGTGTIPN
jgi:hypothetical protein